MARSAKSRAKLPRSAKKAGDGELGGFTIIEVVLVLAIAALIFLMVFIALPTLQRNQRDTQRRNDLARLQTQITNWQSNNSGKLPGNSNIDAIDEDSAKLDETNYKCTRTTSGEQTTDAACLIVNYLNGAGDTMNTFTDPSGWTYGINISTFDATGDEKTLTNADFGEDAGDDKRYKIYVIKKAKCDDEFAVYSNNSRDYAILYKLEGNGVYCKDNQ